MSNNVKQELKFFMIFIPVYLLIIFAAWFYLSSTAFPGFNNNLSKSDIGEIEGNNNIKMIFENQTYSSSVKEMSLDIINNSSLTLEYGASYSFDVNVDGTWYDFPYEGATSWITIGYSLKPGEKINHTIYTDRLKYDLTPGKYRIIKWFNTSRDRSEEIILSAEFEIE